MTERDAVSRIEKQLDDSGISFKREVRCEYGVLDFWLPPVSNQTEAIIEVKRNGYTEFKAGVGQLVFYGIAFPNASLFLAVDEESIRFKQMLHNLPLPIDWWDFNLGHEELQGFLSKDTERINGLCPNHLTQISLHSDEVETLRRELTILRGRLDENNEKILEPLKREIEFLKAELFCYRLYALEEFEAIREKCRKAFGLKNRQSDDFGFNLAMWDKWRQHKYPFEEPL